LAGEIFTEFGFPGKNSKEGGISEVIGKMIRN